jgi:hypothetical protein
MIAFLAQIYHFILAAQNRYFGIEIGLAEKGISLATTWRKKASVL